MSLRSWEVTYRGVGGEMAAALDVPLRGLALVATTVDLKRMCGANGQGGTRWRPICWLS